MSPTNQRGARPDKEIFFDALDIESTLLRNEFLAGACEGDAQRQRLERLIASHFREGAFLETRLADEADCVDAAGAVLGRYKLLEKIGEGGCGSVYVAEQSVPVRRRVALKVIKLGMDTRAVLARFEAERQALAMMDHPNIARILDAGSTETGRPYFVMELVRGNPITSYCDEAALSAQDRLRLFIKVCQAIQHAHQKGIIHRDIKPSNILVTLHDGVPVPKVIDFGIAKATEGRLTDSTVYTQLRQFIGTPAYMSPEQAEMSGLDIDTRSDIYSLGVVLYELLAGSPPFGGKELMDLGIDAMRKTIREKEPATPSSRLAALKGEVLTDTARRRSTDSAKLTHQLRGDLDWIVMKCLEKDRTRRYETANGLASEIQRHLDNEPILARPPSNRYRLQKFISRHKVAFGAASAFAVVIATSLFVSIYLLLSEKAARQRAQVAEQRAGQLRAEAEASAEKAVAAAVASRRSQYAADMIATDAAIRAGNYRRAREMLMQYLPRAGEEELRGFEWRYWWKLSEGEQLRSWALGGEVLNMAWSPDGRLIAAANADNSVKLVDSETGKTVSTFTNHSRRVVSVSFSFDGHGLASASGDGVVNFSDTRDSRLLFSLTNLVVPRAACSPTEPIMAVATGGDDWAQKGGDVFIVDTATGKIVRTLSNAGDRALFSPDGKILATANGVDAKTVTLWDSTTGEKLRELGGMKQTLGMAFSPDGGLLAFGNREGELALWNLVTYERSTLRRNTGDFARSVSFSRDGRRLVAGFQTHELEIWDVAARRQIGRLRGHNAQVWSAAFSPDSTRLASGSEDGTIRLWNPELPTSPKLIPDLFLEQYFWLGRPIFSADSQLLAAPTTNGHVRIVDPRTPGWTELITLTNASRPVRFSADSKTLLTMASDLKAISRWNVSTGQRVSTTTLQTTNSVWDFSAIRPDGAQIALATFYAVEIFDTDNGRLLESFEAPIEARNLEYSPDGKNLAVTGNDGSSVLWDLAARAVKLKLAGHKGNVPCLRFSPDGRTIATTAWDGTIRLWDAATGQLKAVLTGHKAPVLIAVFSPDGRTLVTGSDDRTFRFWNMATFRELASVEQGGAVSVLGFSPDGQILIANNTDYHLHSFRAPSWDQIESSPALLGK